MKKALFLLVVIFGLGLISCNQQPIAPQKVTTTVTNEKVTYSDQGFYVEQQIIVRGNTVWGISEKIYGTGFKWRDIVSQNPFLNTPDRLYYNPDKQMWIVKIFPGEVLNIGGQKVYPSCTYERTVTTTTTEPAPVPATNSTFSTIPWWDILVALALICLTIWAVVSIVNCCRQRGNSNSSSSSSSSAVRVDMNGQGFDTATRRALLERKQGFRDRTLKVIEDNAINGRLKSFFVAENSEAFLAAGSFRRSQVVTEPVKKEDPK